MAWATAAATIASSLIGAFSANKSAKAQTNASQSGLDWVKQVYGDSQGNFSPYLQAGQGGLSGLSSLAGGDYSGFMNSPDYKYALDQEIKGIDRSAAARGGLYSGGHSLDLAQGIQGIASQGLSNYRNSLLDMASMGERSAGTLGQIGSSTFSPVQNGLNDIAAAQRYGNNATSAAAGNIIGQVGNLFGGSSTPNTTSSYGGGTSYGNYGLPPPAPVGHWGY